MARKLTSALITLCVMGSSVLASEIRGTYVEARTCQVYTGPCFANGEVGLAGKNAVMSWRIDSGKQAEVDLKGLSVAVIVKASHTLGFRGLADAKTKKCVILVDQDANTEQSRALQEFALDQTGLAAENVRSVQKAPIEMQFDTAKLTASLEVGKVIKLKMRKARPGDCICSNESAYYPPLVKLKGSVPGVTIEGDVTARRLGTRWSIPDSRTAYLGMFELDPTTTELVSR
jgi:hypothetical protein